MRDLLEDGNIPPAVCTCHLEPKFFAPEDEPGRVVDCEGFEVCSASELTHQAQGFAELIAAALNAYTRDAICCVLHRPEPTVATEDAPETTPGTSTTEPARED